MICYIKTRLKYPQSLKAILRRFLISLKMLFLESPHSMGFLKGSQILQQNCEHIKQTIYLKTWRLIISRISCYRKHFKTSAKFALLYPHNVIFFLLLFFFAGSPLPFQPLLLCFMHSAAGHPTASVPLTDVLTRKSNAPLGGPHFGSKSPLYGA